MCGIVGIIGSRPAAPLLLDALRRLEYRGYDSAGIATLVNGHIERRRAEGKLGNLAAVLDRAPLPGMTGIGHTRWATHGAPTESNAHPHGTARVSIVHNGIIENHAELRAELEAEGQEFSTETDTETVAQLVDLPPRAGHGPGRRRRRGVPAGCEGAYALAMIFAGHPELIVGAQHGAPLAVGFGEGEMFVGSDGLALAPLTRRIAYLEDGDWTVVTRDGARFFDARRGRGGARVQLTRADGGGDRQGRLPALHGKGAARAPGGDRRHPASHGRSGDPGGDAAAAAVRPRRGAADQRERLRLGVLRGAGRALVVRGGGAHPDDGDVASEFRYRAPPLPKGGLGLLISQSGETADTLAALRYMRDAGPARAVGAERAGKQHGARERRGAGNGGRARDRRRLHQGVHRPADRAGLPGLGGGARARRDRARAREATLTAALLEVPARAAEVLARGARDRAHRRARRRGAGRALSRPRQLLPDRAGRARSSSRRSATSTPRATRRAR